MHLLRTAAITLLAACAAAASRAGTVTVRVADAEGRPIVDAVAMLEPLAGRAPVKPMPDTEISQSQKRFAPRVTLVTTGTRIAFPNFDTVRHHVYSFSAAKTFELKLYAGVPAQPVLFDKPGIAVLGCNIHDKMAAWVVVADTPWAARSDADGRAAIDAVPAGDYRLVVWHPALTGLPAPAPVTLRVPAGDLQHTVKLPVELQP